MIKVIIDRKAHYVLIIWPIHEEDIIFSVYIPNHRAEKYVTQQLIGLEGEIDKSAVILLTGISGHPS